MAQHRDLELLREIPGYKAILKALIKSQIQHLVEQLSSYTEEEAVLLSVSTSDGSLSQLGSECGRGFLDNHEEVKAKFLGFCLKRQHYIQDKAAEETQESTQVEAPAAASSLPQRSNLARRPRLTPYTHTNPTNTRKIVQQLPQTPLPHQPLATTQTPTPVHLMQNQSQCNRDNDPANGVVGVKEESDNNFETHTINMGTSVTEGNVNMQHQTQTSQGDNNSGRLVTDTYSSYTSQTSLDNRLGSGSDLGSNSSGQVFSQDLGSNVSIDQSAGLVNVKAEPDGEEEEELSITGVEFSSAGVLGGGAEWQTSGDGNYTADNMAALGRVYCDTNTRAIHDAGVSTSDPAIQMAPPHERLTLLTSGATTNTQTQAPQNLNLTGVQSHPQNLNSIPDLNQSKHLNSSLEHNQQSPITTYTSQDGFVLKIFTCPECSRTFKRKDYLDKHMMIHRGDKPFKCQLCNAAMRQRSQFKIHMLRKHGMKLDGTPLVGSPL